MKRLIVPLAALCICCSMAYAQQTPSASARPAPEKRKFKSEAVEREIVRVTSRMGDPELARIFEACYPNTLDTTVDFGTKDGKPDTFIITGDINAMWLRDSSAQVQGYLPLCKEDPHLAQMIAGLIHRQAEYILIDPYANAFFKDTARTSPHAKDDTEMKPGVFERKWEVDSLLYCMRLAYQYWKITGDTSPFDSQWRDAMRLSVKTLRDQQREKDRGPYHFFRGQPRPGQPDADGYGTPIKYTGMICSMFRDSDDNTKYLFHIPDNLFAVASLKQLAEMADALMPGDPFATDCRTLADQVQGGIDRFGTVEHPKWGKMYAYEVDGLGNQLLMDDAGIPSLLSIPYLCPSLANDPLANNSRHFSLSSDNPFFVIGTVAEGVGSPHTARGTIWPMGIICRAITSTDDAEITQCLSMLKRSSAGTGFMHESFNKDDAKKFTRKWFAWVNNLYGEMIIKILRERPNLLSKPVS